MSESVTSALPSAGAERILIFVPMYNCAPQIPRVIAQLSVATGLPQQLGVLCVDNRSTDTTLAAAEAALDHAPIPTRYLLKNDGNYGLGGSHKVAFEFARTHGYDHVIVLHGDDQGSLAELVPLIAAGEHEKQDALLGARFMRGAHLQGYSLLRTTANEMFNLIFSGVAGKRLYDLGSGLNMFRRSIFDGGFHLLYADDLTFNYYLVFGLSDRRLRVRFFPISWREDDQISNAKLFGQGLKMLRLLRQRIASKRRFHEIEHRAQPRQAYPSTLIREWVV